jgi:hypothetical protein
MIKRAVLSLLFSFFVTYLTLFLPQEITVSRPSVLGCEKSCEVAAAGLPLPYLIDGYTSPIGSISKNPLMIILTKTDIFSMSNYLIDLFFWSVIIYFLLYKSRKIRKGKI